MISVAITASWREEPMLDETIRSLRQSGFNQKFFVFLEPDVYVGNHDNIEIFRNEQRLGNCLHRIKALRYMLENSKNPFYMTVEDDIECCNDAAKHINRLCIIKKNENFGFISGYTPLAYAMSDPFFKDLRGWVTFNRKEYTWGGQCLIFSKSSAELFCNSDHKFKIGQHDIDKKIGIFFGDHNMPCYYPAPSLFEHKGLYNSIYNRAPDILNTGLRYKEKFRFALYDAFQNEIISQFTPKFV